MNKCLVFFKNIRLSWINSTVSKRFFISVAIISFFIFLIGFGLVFIDTIGGFDTYAILKYRLPRMPLLIIMGVGTPLSALLIQKITRNNLADAGLIGISHSGVFALSIISIYAPSIINPINNTLTISLITPLIIGVSAFITMIMLYVLSIKQGVSPERVILMGIGLHIFFSGAATLVVFFNNGYEISFFTRYLMGFIEKKPVLLWIVSATIIVCVIIFTWIIGKKLDILESDENMARSVGIRVELLKFVVFVVVALAIGATVSSVGSVALLGLFVPNIARSLVGSKTRSLLIVSSLFGIMFVFLAQFINVNWSHVSAPIGILLQILIAPYFIYKIFKRSNNV
ncbi:iron ABC transporter permease [Candidatus Mycoplasma mahonii]|uniref:iron ABC transporter permease n=1 Tax=Candidatus Mycoplasma mahonii TaxID=3004105 RepID=UPI0026EE9678|nr:iron ABC transporter permease [Candidatus Mycoplasma mahonii]WKX02383.1 iron ABC transporter permease [Candidatus Mycoplasma mahonii]